MPTPLLVQTLALLSAPLAGLAGALGLRLRRTACGGEDREGGLRQQVVELQKRCEELERTAARDPLTGVWNYRHLRLTLEHEIERCRRRPDADGPPGTLAVVLLAIAGFDAVNAEHGRSQGDVMLRELAQRLSVEIRRSDTLGRYGGAEFLVVLPDTGAEGAVKVAERLCWSVRRHRLFDRAADPWQAGTDLPSWQESGLTAAAGIAVLPGDGTHAAPLLRAADRALAAAKLRSVARREGGDGRLRDGTGTRGSLSPCAGPGSAALAGRARTVAAVAVADEVPS